METPLASFAEFAFFICALLVFVFSLFALTFILVHDANQPGHEDPRLRVIMLESLPLPDWKEIRTFLSFLFGFVGAGMIFLYEIRTMDSIHFTWIFISNKILLICGLLLVFWCLFYARLRAQIRRRKYFLDHFRTWDFTKRAQLQAAGRLQARLNIRTCILTENNQTVSLFFRTRKKTSETVNGTYNVIPGRFSKKGMIMFIADDHLDYLLSRKPKA